VGAFVVAHDAPPADPAMYLVLGRGIVGNASVRDVFDMPANALEDVGGFLGGFVANRADAHLRLVLFGVVDDLQAVLAGFVDGQRRAVGALGIEVVGPLPVVV